MSHNDLCKSVFQAVEDSVAPEDRAAYDEAMEKVPHLILEESDPQAFVTHAEGDIAAAAQRLVAFWHKKRRVFDDRFLLPLNTLSGQGALTTEDVQTLRTGFLSFLPDDAQGRTVIYFDNSKGGQFLDGASCRAARFRCLFYMSYLAAREAKPILLLRFSNTTKMYLGKAERVFRLFSSLPVRLELFLNLYHAPPGARRMFEKTVVPLFEDFPGKAQYAHVLKSYVGDSSEDLRAELSKHGLTEDSHIPPSAGGSWHSDSHSRWLSELEQASSGAVLKAPPSVAVVEHSDDTHDHEEDVGEDYDSEDSKPAAATGNRKRSATDAGMNDLLLMKARADRKRMMDRKYSEQRRQREKQEESTLYKQYVQLNAANKKMRSEESQLLQMLAEARAKVAQAQAEEQQAAAVRIARQNSLASLSSSHLQQLLQSSRCLSSTGLSLPAPPSGNGLAALLMRHQQQQQQQNRSFLGAASMANAPFRPTPVPSDSALFLQMLAQQGGQPTSNANAAQAFAPAPVSNPFLSALGEDPQQRALRELLAMNRRN